MVSIVNFQITPYSENVADYISKLSDQEIYTIFKSDTSTDILTAALHTIYKLEFQARNSIVNNPPPTWIAQKGLSICPNATIDPKVLQSLEDVFLRDALLFDSNLNDLNIYPNAFVLVVNGMYAGHIYAWTVDKVTNVIGIRTSIFQILIDKCGLKQEGVTSIFLNSIQDWSKASNVSYLRIIQPIGPMPKLLQRKGFILAKTIRNDPNLEWLFDNKSLGDMPMTRITIFRNFDYIKQLQ